MKFRRIISLLLCLCFISSFFTVSYATEIVDDSTYKESIADDEILYEKYWADKIPTEVDDEVNLFASSYPATLSDMKARAEAIVNYTWTPSVDIKTWNGNKYKGSDTFKKGVAVKGMPYTLFTSEISGVSDSLLSLAQYKNKVSSNKSASAYCVSVSATRTGPVYGSCCATFVSEVFGGNFMSGDNPVYDSVAGLEQSSYTTVSTGTVSQIKEGDALSIPHHVIWVGEITDTTMTIYEQTPPVAIKKTITKPAGDKYLSYGGATYKTIIRPNSLKDQKTVLSTPTVNLNGKAIGTLEKNAENKVSCKVGDTVTFGWSGINNASTYQYAVARLPVGHTPNPSDNYESTKGTMLKEGSGNDALSIPLTEAGVYKFAVCAKGNGTTYVDSDWAKVYLKVDASGNVNTSAPTNVKAKLSSSYVEEGEAFTFSMSADNATSFYAKFFKENGTAVWPKYEKISGTETLSVPTAGKYYFESYAENDYGKTNASKVYLTVEEKNSDSGVTPTPPSGNEGVLTINATESSLAPYPCQYTDVNGKLVSGNLQRIWPTTYSCDSSVLSWEAWPGTICYQIAVRDLASNELVYEAYEYYDTKLEIGKLFRVDAPVRVWVAARDYQKKILAQGTATYYMSKPTMEWTNPNQKEYYLMGEKMPVNIVATGLNKVVAYYKRSNETEWTKFGEVTSSAGMYNNINQDINLDTTGMRKGTYRVRLEGYINDDMTPMSHTLDEFVLRTYPPEKTVKKLYLKFKDGTTMVQNGDSKDVYTNDPVEFNVIAQFEDGSESDISTEALDFDCENGITVSKTSNNYSLKVLKNSIYCFDVIHDGQNYGCFNFSATTIDEIKGVHDPIYLRVGDSFEFTTIARSEDKWNFDYEFPIVESEMSTKSGNTSIMTVKTTNDKCIVSGVSAGETTLSLTYKGCTKTIKVYVYPKVNATTLKSITCDVGSNITVYKGSTKVFTVYANYSDGSKEVLAGISGLTHSVSNVSIANVEIEGLSNYCTIEGLKVGTTKVTLSYGGKTSTLNITVKEPTGSDIKKINLHTYGTNGGRVIAPNGTIYLAEADDYVDCYVGVTFIDGSQMSIEYDESEDDEYQNVIFSVSNSKMDEPSERYGNVRFMANANSGTSVITAKYKGFSQKINVKIGSYTKEVPVSTTEIVEIKDTKVKLRTIISNASIAEIIDSTPNLKLLENGEVKDWIFVNINTEFKPTQTTYEYWIESLLPNNHYEYTISFDNQYGGGKTNKLQFVTNANKIKEFVNISIDETDITIPAGEDKEVKVYAHYKDGSTENVSDLCSLKRGDIVWFDKTPTDSFLITTDEEELGSSYADVTYNGITIRINVNIVQPTINSVTTGGFTKTTTTATLNGSYTGAVTAPSEYGFIYSVNGVDKTVKIGSGTTGDKSFSKTITGLSSDTFYSYRSYAVVNGLYYYGDSKTFKTDKGTTLPNVEIKEATNVDITKATVNANITDNGNGTISSYGFYYGITDAASTKKVVGSNNMTGAYSANLTGLQPNTTYFVKSFVVNQAGEYISNYTTFNTLPKEPEVLGITTNLSDSISLEVDEAKQIYLSAQLDNNSNVAVPMNSTDFTFASNNANIATIVTEGSNGIITGVGKGSCKVTLTYKGFSKVINVTVTDKTSLPVVSSKDASNVASTSAMLNGSVANNGNLDIIETGFYYYPKNNAKNKYQVVCDTTDTNFNYEVKGLLEKTDYYFYAYAVNEKGTSIGEKISFTTKDGNSLPNDIKLNASFLSVEIYNSQSLLATVLPENATNKDVVWKSQDDTIASVSQNGVVTGNNVGKTKILAITVANRIVASCDVEVTYPKASDEYDFSEIHMAASMSELSKTGWDLPVSAGGNITMATAYLSRWDGAVLEEDAPYPSSYDNVKLDNANASKHVQNVYYLPPRQSATDNNDIKATVMNYGAVSSSFRYAGEYFADDYSNYYVPENVATPTGGHAVAIVGWDDSYSKSNFKYTPAGDGAFLCKNSWGATTAEEGYFWISYYDATFAKGQEQVAVFIGAEDTDNYNKIYQYDPLGCVSTVSSNTNTTMIANAFMGGHNDEVLKAVSFYTFEKGVDYEVYAVKDFLNSKSLKVLGEPLASGQLDYAGYHTVDLEKTVNIGANKKFAVVVKLTSNGKTVIALENPISYASNARANKNESFMSFNGAWVDITSLYKNANICLKAFTDVTGTSQGVLLMGVDNENRTYYSEMAEPIEGINIIDVTPRAYKDFFENLDGEISLFSTDSSEDYGVIPLPFLSGNNGIDVSEGVALPAEYDLRTFDRVSSVKDQGPLGTCWTFSTYASLESCLKGKADSVITANGMIFSNSGLIAPESVEINVEEITIAYNGEAYLSADVLPNAADKSVIWSSSDEEVVTVSSNGRINGVSEGVALVFATSKDGSVMDFCTVEVTAPADLESINLSEDNIYIATGDIHLIDYVLYPTNVANQKIVWSTDNGSVASVSEYGVLTGVNDGVAVITASSEDGSCVAKVNVTVGEGQNSESALLFTVANSTSNNNVTVTVSNNTKTKQTGVMFFAVYDTQGRLVNLYDEDISLDGLANTSYTYSVASGMNVKSFVWSSLGNLKPISNVAE